MSDREAAADALANALGGFEVAARNPIGESVPMPHLVVALDQIDYLDAHPTEKAALAAWLGLPTCAVCYRIATHGYHKRVGRTWEPPQHPFSGPTPTPRVPDELRELSEKATPGPWARFHHAASNTTDVHEAQRMTPPIIGWMGFDDSSRKRSQHGANAAFIAAAVNFVRGLIKEQP